MEGQRRGKVKTERKGEIMTEFLKRREDQVREREKTKGGREKRQWKSEKRQSE